MIVKSLDISANVKNSISHAYILNTSSVGWILNKLITEGKNLSNQLSYLISTSPSAAKIVDTYVINEVSTSIIFNFTQADLVNGKLVRSHNFGQSVVDVSISTNLGKEIEAGVNYFSANVVEIDFTRCQPLTGVWSILIEK